MNTWAEWGVCNELTHLKIQASVSLSRGSFWGQNQTEELFGLDTASDSAPWPLSGKQPASFFIFLPGNHSS